MFVCSSGDLLTCGSNTRGQLGLKSKVDQLVPKAVSMFRNRADEVIISIDGGAFHSLVATSLGNVYGWGASDQGQLGLSSNLWSRDGQAKEITRPRLIHELLDNKIQQVACGAFHSAVVTTDGHILTFGYGDYGQLGQGSVESSKSPTLVAGNLVDKVAIQVDCGSWHTVALVGSLEQLQSNRHKALQLIDVDKRASSPLSSDNEENQIEGIESSASNSFSSWLDAMPFCRGVRNTSRKPRRR
jgi:alpha-tubulin suppressor-like RCC1 family protein